MQYTTGNWLGVIDEREINFAEYELRRWASTESICQLPDNFGRKMTNRHYIVFENQEHPEEKKRRYFSITVIRLFTSYILKL